MQQPGPPPQYQPPGQGYAPPPGQPGYPPQQGYGQPQPMMTGQTHNVVVVSQPGTRVVGSCGRCGVGVARENYSVIGIIIAILFFPLGVICCLMMTERRCSHCGAPM